MKKLREITFDRMYSFEANGAALLGIGTLILYGFISLMADCVQVLWK